MVDAAQVEEKPAYSKLTWREFKSLCEQHGISDKDVIDDIDISWGKKDSFKCEWDEVFGWKISLISA